MGDEYGTKASISMTSTIKDSGRNKSYLGPGEYNIPRSFESNRYLLSSNTYTIGKERRNLVAKENINKNDMLGPGCYNPEYPHTSISYSISTYEDKINKTIHKNLGPGCYSCDYDKFYPFPSSRPGKFDVTPRFVSPDANSRWMERLNQYIPANKVLSKSDQKYSNRENLNMSPLTKAEI